MHEGHSELHTNKISNGGTFNWDDSVAVYPIEPEAPTAAQEAAMDELTHLRQEMEAQPPRRPPYAVAYALEGGAQYEIALPGDATIRAEAGALIITHASAVLALTQARPMEG